MQPEPTGWSTAHSQGEQSDVLVEGAGGARAEGDRLDP
jgi:hypothetical protein